MKGQLYRDADSGKTILVDGIIASLFYAFDRYADKAVINSTMARNFGFDNLKNARLLLYQAFSLAESNGKIVDKRTEDTLLKDLWEKISKIDMIGNDDVVVCMPYNFSIPQFLSDAEYMSEVSNTTSVSMVMEKMSVLEKNVQEKNTIMMNMLQVINDKLSVNSVTPTPSFTQTYATTVRGSAAAAARIQGPTQNLRVAGGSIRDRSPSVKRGINDTENNKPNKKRNIDIKKKFLDQELVIRLGK